MDRPLGPRAQPAERSTAYEDIFGRRPRAQQLPQSQSRQPQQGYYPQQPYQQQYPGQPQYPPQQQGYYAPPQQQGYGQQQVYSQYQTPYPSHPHAQQGYPGPGPGYGRPPSLRPPTHLSGGAGGVGVPAVPPDGRVDGQGLTPAQAYQAQVAGWRSPSPAPSHMSGGSGRVPVGMGPPPSYTPPPQMHPHPHSHPHGQSHLHPQQPQPQPQQPPEGTGGERRRDRSSVPPALNVPIGGLDGGRLGLDFDADSPRGWDAAPPAATANGTRAVLEEDEEDERGGREGRDGEEDDEESELPWARSTTQIQPQTQPPYTAAAAQFAHSQRYPQARAAAHRFSSASDTPPTSLRSSIASASTSPTSLDHEGYSKGTPIANGNGFTGMGGHGHAHGHHSPASIASQSPASVSHVPVSLAHSSSAAPGTSSSVAARRASETARALPRLVGPRRERTPQDRAMSMSAVSTPTSPTNPTLPPGAAQPYNAPHPHGLPHHANSSSSTVAATKRKRPPQPIVYPALLSRVAEAFRARVPRADRVKDGLTYHDAFDGREAVDRIAHIIKTTDRNLALLLGRALDAQKFFHDVTYDHRLRDSVVELYQFRTKLPSPFGSGELAGAGGVRPGDGGADLLGAPAPPGGVLSPDSFDGPVGLDAGAPGASPAVEEDEAPLPSGVFTLLADCYSPTCSADQLCYSIACPRRLEQQARLNMKPQPGLRKEPSRESLGADEPDAGILWIHTVSPEVLANVSDAEKKRQEAINEVIYTERDFVRDMEYLRDTWVARLAAADIIPQERREQFLIQVFWNAHDIITVNTKLRDALNKRQRAFAIVEKIGDIFLDAVPHFEPFVSYGAHQLYGKYEFEKEKSANPEFAAFVEATERLPESRKLELNAYLTKPTTRLARYPLLLEAVIKHTPEDSPDKVVLPQVVAQIRAFLSRVNEESGRAENRFNLAQLDSQLIFKPGEQVDLRLQEDGRELVYKGMLNKRDGELQVYLFDHALLFAKPLKTKTHEQFRVYRRPIPLELLLISASEDPSHNGKDTMRGGRSRQLVRKSSFGSNAPRATPHPPSVNVRPDAKGPHWITFAHLGRKAYSLVLWANSALAQRKWVEHIAKQQTAMRERSMVFETFALSEGFFGTNKVNCAAPFSGGRRIVYGTDDGVYISDLRDISKDPVKVLALLDVAQVDVLEDYQLLIVLSERQVLTFPLEALDPMDPTAGLKRAKRIATHTSFFKAGFCLNRVLVCIVKSTQLSSTFKALEPIEQQVRGRAKPTFKKLLQGGNDTLKPFREFYIPVESTSIHYLKTRMCIGCSKGFEIVDLETLETQGLLDPSDESLEFVRKRENLRPMAIYRINNDFLLCYDEFAFYVNRTGRRSRKEFMVFWEGTPTGFALHEPYVLAFEPSFVEIRHIETGLMSQVIQGSNLRLLFADTPPSVNNGGGGYNYQGGYDPYNPPNSATSRASAYSSYALPPHMQHPHQYPQQQHRYPQGVGRDEILMVSDDRVLALRTAAGPQRFMSDNVSMMSMPR